MRANVADATARGRSQRAILASDALFVLRAAVGSESCAQCVCDADGSGATSATDALIVLRRAVGQPAELSCPPCSIAL